MADAMTSFAPMPCPKCKILTTWFFDGLCWECARAKRPVVGDELNDKLIEWHEIEARAICAIIDMLAIRHNTSRLTETDEAVQQIVLDIEKLKDARKNG